MLFQFLACSVPSLVVRAVGCGGTLQLGTFQKERVWKERQQTEQPASNPWLRSKVEEEEDDIQRVTEKCSTSARARTHQYFGAENCPSRAAEIYVPTWQSWHKKGISCLSVSWALRQKFSISWAGLKLFSRKLLWPPKHSKLGESSTLQITHTAKTAVASVTNLLLWARAGSTSFTRLS